MNILFVHRYFPVQFRYLIQHFKKDINNKVALITSQKDVKGSRLLIYYYTVEREEAMLHAHAAARTAIKLKNDGFSPDIIFGHARDTLCFIKDVFPQVPLIGYFEWFYQSEGANANFEQTNPLSYEQKAQIRLANANILIELYSCDYGVTPTKWQHQQFPSEFQQKLTILPDGIDTDFFKPDPNSKGFHVDKLNLHIGADQEIVTYTSRGLEPYRGFPQFMEAVALLLKRRPNCHFIVSGTDRVYYGAALPEGQNFRELMVKKLDIDLSRVHFVGDLPYLKIFQSSWVHVYLTYPFVRSGSIMEAMASGCLLVTSNTEPVQELVEHGVNGFLVDFFSPRELADRIEDCLNNRKNLQHICQAARNTIIEKHELQKCLRRQLAFMSRCSDR